MRAYLDHASSSPLRPEVREALSEVLEIAQCDPGRPYEEALVVRNLIEDARSSVARLVQVTPRQVIFTSSIAESINHGVQIFGGNRVVLATGAERSSTLEAARVQGSLELIGLDRLGHPDLDALDARLSHGGVSLVCCQVANHETGVLGQAEEVIALVRRHGVAVHVDATIAAGHVALNLGQLDADIATVSSELLGGPQGVAALIVRKGTVLPPMIFGGAQERARRAGLENPLGIVGFGIAAEVLCAPGKLVSEEQVARSHLAHLETAALNVEGVHAVGDPESEHRAPWLRCFTIDGVESEGVVMGLDRAGVSVHSGSACSAESLEPSPVLAAMGLEADHSLRLSVGWSTTEAEVERFATVFPEVVARLRSLRR
jgi:cysteine desulfurase